MGIKKSSHQLLEITIISAQDLEPKKKKMRTYVTAWINPARKMTTVVDSDGGSNPSWNDKFVFRVDEEFLRSESSAVDFEIYKVGWLRPSLIGTVRLLVGNLIPPPDHHQHFGARFAAVQVRQPSGSPQGILNIGVAVLDSSMRSMPHDDDSKASPSKPVLRRSRSDRSEFLGLEKKKDSKSDDDDDKASSILSISMYRPPPPPPLTEETGGEKEKAAVRRRKDNKIDNDKESSFLSMSWYRPPPSPPPLTAAETSGKKEKAAGRRRKDKVDDDKASSILSMSWYPPPPQQPVTEEMIGKKEKAAVRRRKDKFDDDKASSILSIYPPPPPPPLTAETTGKKEKAAVGRRKDKFDDDKASSILSIYPPPPPPPLTSETTGKKEKAAVGRRKDKVDDDKASSILSIYPPPPPQPLTAETTGKKAKAAVRRRKDKVDAILSMSWYRPPPPPPPPLTEETNGKKEKAASVINGADIKYDGKFKSYNGKRSSVVSDSIMIRNSLPAGKIAKNSEAQEKYKEIMKYGPESPIKNVVNGMTGKSGISVGGLPNSEKTGVVVGGKPNNKLVIGGGPYKANYISTDSEVGPSQSEVAAEMAEKPRYPLEDSILDGWSLDESEEGLRSKLERWRTELPPLYDHGGGGGYAASSSFGRSSSGFTADKKRGKKNGLFSCFGNFVGYECQCVCGQPRRKKSAAVKARLESPSPFR